MLKIKEKIIHLLGGFTKEDLYENIKRDREKNNNPKIYQSAISVIGVPSSASEKHCKAIMLEKISREIERNCIINSCYNAYGDFTNYFLTIYFEPTIEQDRSKFYEEDK